MMFREHKPLPIDDDDMTCREFVELLLRYMAVHHLERFTIKDDNGEEYLVEYDRLVKALGDERLDH